ncbi:MAG: M23 family metallopeptidase [Anaerolineae bacterium]|jgi:murein DD-endopeptidase MepM/ murein hydrolase activator NlpD|nr:M23 family metallopeptidase [Anaerolineae bacterium]
MSRLIETLLTLLRALFQRAPADTCQVSDLEIPAERPPLLPETAALAFTAQAGTPAVTIRPLLSRAHIFTEPALTATPLLVARGGLSFPLLAATPADPDGFRWLQVQVAGQAGWLRAELVTLNDDCRRVPGIAAADIPDPAPKPAAPPAARFPLPADVRITQRFHSGHRGYDQGTPLNTPIRAAAPGLVIRALTCQRCEERSRPNIFPCGQAIYRDPAWGFGYGNFVVLRHDYAAMPAELRAEMDRAKLTGAFVYVLYAHFSRLNVQVGQQLSAGHVLGLSGNHGCSSGPHLHFEVRGGTVDLVDNVWAAQRAFNPNRLFQA